MLPMLPCFHRRQSNKSLAVWGWWQGENLGDNWIRASLSSVFPSADFVGTGLRRLSPYGFVLCGGGGLFVRGVIPPWDRRATSFFGPTTPFGLIGLGAEFPHRDGTAKSLARRASFFFVRDQHSVDCMHLPADHRSVDLTFLEPLAELRPWRPRRALFVWRDVDELLRFPDFREYIGPVASRETWKGKLAGVFNSVLEHSFQTRQANIDALTGDVGFIISARYHGVVAAIQRQIPCIGIDLCPKIRALMQEAGLEEYCLKIGEADSLRKRVAQALADRDRIRSRQRQFTETSHSTVCRHVAWAKAKIKETHVGR